MVYTSVINADFVYKNRRPLIAVAKLPVKVKSLINKILGFIGLVLFFAPLYYTLILPLSVLFYSVLYHKIKEFSNFIDDFKLLNEEKQNEKLENFKKTNMIFSKISRELKRNKSKIYWTAPLCKSFKRFKSVFVDIEDDMLAVKHKNDEPFEVTNLSDNEIINLISSSMFT